MRKSIIAGILFAATAALADQSRTTVALDWQHQERIDPTLAVYMTSRLPTGSVTFRRWASGTQSVDVKLENGQVCSTVGKHLMEMQLKCGGLDSYYWVVKQPRKAITVEIIKELSK